MLNNKVLTEIVVSLIVLALVGVGIYFLVQKFGKDTTQEEILQDGDSLGEELFNQVKNPTEDLPQTNPLETDANPFEKENPNPFSSYTNPFE